MRRSTRVLVVAGVVPALVTSGCSALLSRPPPERPLALASECSRVRAPEIVDAIAGGITGGFAALILGVALISYENSKDDVQASWEVHRIGPDQGLLVAGGLAAVGAAALLTSAKYGHDSSRACDAARADLRMRQAPAWLPPPPWPPPPRAP